MAIQDPRLIEKLLTVAYFTPCGARGWGLPLTLWGPPGGGKSSHFRRFAARVGFFYKRLSPAESGEGEFGTTPVPERRGTLAVDERTVITHPPNEWITKLQPGSIVLVDDISCTSQYLQPYLLSIFLDKVIGDAPFGPGVRVFGAGNDTDDVGGGQDLGKAQANRMGHVEVGYPTGEQWSDWLMSDGGENGHGEMIAVEEEEKRVLAAWPAAYAWARGVFGSYARGKAAMFTLPESGAAKASRAWCSPRSAEFAVRALAAGRVHGLSETETDELMTSFIGAGLVGEVRAHANRIELPDPADLLSGAVQWKHNPARLDLTLAVTTSTTAYVTSQPEDATGARALLASKVWGLLGGIERPLDLLVPAVHQLVRSRLDTRGGEKDGKLNSDGAKACASAARPVLLRLKDVLVAAGVRLS